MATPSSGAFKFTDIENEFGQATTRSIGSYVSDTWDYGDYEAPLDRGPEGGTSTPTVKQNVKFSDFYNRELNIVTDFYSGGTVYRQNAKTQYNSNSDVVGPGGSTYGNGSVSVPASTAGRRVTISVNKTIGSEKTTDSGAGNSGEQKVALRTGNGWTAGTELFVHVGNSGFITGAGGDGGNGSSGGGEAGDNATSALGIEWEGTVVTAINNGKITHGYPGGGGGGGAWAEREEWWSGPTKSISGSGGGGGAGLPFGEGGSNGNGGGDGTQTTAGSGGGGTANTGEGYGVHGGAGGQGADSEQSASSGGSGFTSGNTENTSTGGGGAAGQGLGAAIRKTSGISWSFGTGHVTNNVVGEGKDGSGESPTGVS